LRSAISQRASGEKVELATFVISCFVPVCRSSSTNVRVPVPPWAAPPARPGGA
jgi:hypothetical protein